MTKAKDKSNGKNNSRKILAFGREVAPLARL
jgi:hypothetical protein